MLKTVNYYTYKGYVLKTENIYTYKGYVLNTVNIYTYKGYEGYLGSAGDMHVYIRTVTKDCMLKKVDILYLKNSEHFILAKVVKSGEVLQ